MSRIANTTTPLGANAEWKQTIDVGLADTITGSVFADQTGTLYIEQSGDGTNWDISTSHAVVASVGQAFTEPVYLPNVRIRFKNGGTPQGVLRVYTRVTSAGPR